MSSKTGIWLLDPRFDFLLPWFQDYYGLEADDVILIGSYHGSTRRGRRLITVGPSVADHITFLEPEDVNRRSLPLLKQLDPDVVGSFNGAYLPDKPTFSSALAGGEIAILANSKQWQYDFFSRKGIPTPKTWKAASTDELKECLAEILPLCGRVVIKLPELSGGYRMASLSSIDEADAYLSGSSSSEMSVLLLSEYIPHTQSYAGMGIVTREGTVHWCGATEQVLFHDFAYEGLIYPPFADYKTQRELERLTVAVGKGLASFGYYGFFNVDFILGTEQLYAVEINARFGFGTLLYACECGNRFWDAVQNRPIKLSSPSQRLILGKFKARSGRSYSGLHSESDILHWYAAGTGRFQTFFCGLERSETFDYGSFIGLFGSFLPMEYPRDAVLEQFWKDCLSLY